MQLYKVVLHPDGTPSLQSAEEEDIRNAFLDPIREEALQKADVSRKEAWEYQRQAHKFHDAISHLRKLVRKVDAGEMDLKDVVAMLDRTSGNVIDLEAIGGGFQATPMPDSKIPE